MPNDKTTFKIDVDINSKSIESMINSLELGEESAKKLTDALAKVHNEAEKSGDLKFGVDEESFAELENYGKAIKELIEENQKSLKSAKLTGDIEEIEKITNELEKQKELLDEVNNQKNLKKAIEILPANTTSKEILKYATKLNAFDKASARSADFQNSLSEYTKMESMLDPQGAKMREIQQKYEDKNYAAKLRRQDSKAEEGFNLNIGKKINNLFSNANGSFSRKKETFDEMVSFNKERMRNLQTVIAQEKAEGKDTSAHEKELSGLSKANSSLSKNRAAINAMQYALNSVKNLGTLAKKTFDAMGFSLSSVISDAVKTATEAISLEKGVATYSTGTSLISNSQARNQQMKYGLSNSQNYALSQTMGMLNMGEEDLMYMNSAQKEKFSQLMDKYSSWYNKMESSGALESLQEAQLEFKMFKQELGMKLLNWFSQNKDRIMTMINVIMDVTSKVADFVFAILNALPWTKGRYSSMSSASSSDSVSTNSQSTSINVNINSSTNATAVLNNQQELQNTLNNSNSNLVKQLASAFNSY